MSKRRELVFRLTSKDFEFEHFRAGGKGGQNQNKRDTGTRCRHRPSGAVGESREHRTQLQNKRAAFRRMAESDKFQIWVKTRAMDLPPIDQLVDAMMEESNIKVEVRDENGKWVIQHG